MRQHSAAPEHSPNHSVDNACSQGGGGGGGRTWALNETTSVDITH